MTYSKWFFIYLIVPIISLVQPRSEESDLISMQGEWIVASLTVDGRKVIEEACEEMKWTVKGRQINAYFSPYACTLVGIDSSKPTKTIAIEVISSRKPMKAIYEIRNKKWKIAFLDWGLELPSSFESRKGSNITTIILTRVDRPMKTASMP